MVDDTLHDVSDQPDHGRGGIGRVTHGFLAAVRASEDLPKLALAYNILDDPPGPPGYGEFEAPPQLWDVAGPDVHRYLALITHVLRTAPTVDPGEVDAPDEDGVATRLDGIAMAFAAAAARTDADPAGRALAANVVEGYYRPGDVAAMPAARRTLMALGVSRTGDTALLSLAPGAIAPVSETSKEDKVTGALVDSLSNLLAALWSHMEGFDQTLQDQTSPDGLPDEERP